MAPSDAARCCTVTPPRGKQKCHAAELLFDYKLLLKGRSLPGVCSSCWGENFFRRYSLICPQPNTGTNSSAFIPSLWESNKHHSKQEKFGIEQEVAINHYQITLFLLFICSYSKGKKLLSHVVLINKHTALLFSVCWQFFSLFI